MTTRVDIRLLDLEIVRTVLRSALPPDAKAWVFGSRATWKTKGSSDLDLAIDADRPLTRSERNLLADAFEDSDLTYTVDVIDAWTADARLLEIISEEKVLLDFSPEGSSPICGDLTLSTIGQATEIYDAFRKPIKSSERKPGPYPYYGAQGVVDHVDGYCFDGEYILVAEDGENLRSRKQPIAVRASGKFWVNNHAHVLRAKSGVDPDYLFYCINHAEISGHVTGSTIPKLSQNSLKGLMIPLPDESTQKAIGSTLRALDDKIDLNRRMNATLEAMARALFKDWFVDFGPTRAKAEGRPPYLPPELWALFPERLDDDGKPKGWRRSTVTEIVEFLDYKRVPISSRERKKRSGPYPYYGATSVVDYIDDYLFDEPLLLLGEDGSVARENGYPFTQYAWGKIWVNNHAHVLKGSRFSVEQLKCFFDHSDISPFVTGAVQPKLSQENLRRVPVTLAPERLHCAFDDVTRDFFSMIRSNFDETQKLSTLREYLLPGLISGEIFLKDCG